MQKPALPKSLQAAALALIVAQAAYAAVNITPNGPDNLSFSLDGFKCGPIKNVAGGSISGEVINEPGGSDYFVKKHIGQPKYEEFEMQVGFGMSQPFYNWITSSWQQNYQRKDGSIVAADYNLNAKSERQFFNALITETTIPACDGASKDPAYITLKFAPGFIRYIKGTGKVTPDSSRPQKPWLPSNFRLEIDGLDCSKVSKVDAFTVKSTLPNDNLGEAGNVQLVPGKTDFPNLVLTLAEDDAESFRAWHDDFVIKGNASGDKEKNGVLYLLPQTPGAPLMTIYFQNLGIFNLSYDKSEANDVKVKHVKVQLYCERMEIKAGTPPKENLDAQ